MPAKKLTEKRADQAKLKQLRRVVVTLEASEEILQRLAALLLFATVPYELEEAPALGPLPWEDPASPRFIPEPQIDYNAVRNDIIKAMDAWLKGGGEREKIVELIKWHHGTKLSDVPQECLIDLLEDLNRLNQSKDT